MYLIVGYTALIYKNHPKSNMESWNQKKKLLESDVPFGDNMR
jgi:hypothetical protein